MDISLPCQRVFMEFILLTLAQLSLYDGKDGRPAYVAYKGKIFDVTASYTWRGGIHQVIHLAGRDLTPAIKDAPHGEDLLDRFPVVGALQEEQGDERG